MSTLICLSSFIYPGNDIGLAISASFHLSSSLYIQLQVSSFSRSFWYIDEIE